MKRLLYLEKIHAIFSTHPICYVQGPRQVGKTTLARDYVQEFSATSVLFLDIENPADKLRLENPLFVLSQSKADLVVIDEIQLMPDLFSILRVLVDQPGSTKKFLILGSASRDLIAHSSQTLAGRVGFIELAPFSLFEVHEQERLLARGGYPKSYYALSDAKSVDWRKNYITTFLERDIPNLGFSIPPAHLGRFWAMLAHYHGQIMNYSEIGRALMISDNTVRRYLDILEGTFMIRRLVPWFENIAKRQVKSPKLYFKDTGILLALLGIEGYEQLWVHPKLGAVWEGFALEEIMRTLMISSNKVFFWATHADAELDLLIFYRGKRIGFECKYSDAPRITPSMRSAIGTLNLDKLFIIYPGNQAYPLDEKIEVLPLEQIATVKSV